MPSPRRRFEYACRVGVFALLGWLLGTALFPSLRRHVERASAAELPGKLAGWSRAGTGIAFHGDFMTTPAPWAIDWLAALAHAGRSVTWSGTPPAVAMSAEPMPGPDDGSRIDISAPEGTTVVLRDDASTIDSVRVSKFGASVAAPVIVGPIVAMAGQQRMQVAPPDSESVRAIVVIGSAGWEGKFAVDALEAMGWPVVARFTVAPNVEVDQGAAGALSLDTSRVGAVVAIDTTIARYAGAVERFVRSGGGLVLAGPSSLSASLGDLAPGSLGARTRPVVGATDTISLGSTGLYPIAALKQDGVVLERRPGGVAVAARRVGAGRVIQLGYDDSWRWRMAGASGSEDAHREWWSRVVSSVVYRPGDGRAAAASDESAPLARLVDRLGPARSVPAADARHAPLDRRLFLSAIMILLLAEWASRRLRGLR